MHNLGTSHCIDKQLHVMDNIYPPALLDKHTGANSSSFRKTTNWKLRKDRCNGPLVTGVYYVQDDIAHENPHIDRYMLRAFRA